ncbi:MAG: ThiF family adenylyltransferase [Desulfobacteraceae bacterium]|nr:ThiF family adenylyltransferase [Desulfobacteraceae bacterium]
MFFWFLSDIIRLNQERESIEELQGRFEWLKDVIWRLSKNALCIDTDIDINGTLYPVTLEYPATFPDSPPSVIPRETEGRWSEHQYGSSGELCLEWGPDNWEPHISGAQMLESAHRLLCTENPPDNDEKTFVPSRHLTTSGQELRNRHLRFFLTSEFLNIIKEISDEKEAEIKVQVLWSEKSSVAVVKSIKWGEKGWADLSIPQNLHHFAGNYNGRLIIRRALRLPANPDSIEELLRIADYSGPFPANAGKPEFLLIQWNNETKLSWFIKSDKETLWHASTIHCAEEPLSSRLNSEYDKLSEKTVGIAGCGSVGSKLALSLARSGVGKFLLIDDDIFLEENLCRNDLDWMNLGQHKVDGVAQRIQLVNPKTECKVRRIRLTGQETSQGVASALMSLAQCDIIIDATGTGETLNQLAAASRIGKKPLIWMEVFAGGIGGLIARHRPYKEPLPQIMRKKILAWCEENGAPWNRPSHNYMTESEKGEPMIADDAEVAIIAAHSARFVLDSLLEREPSIFPYSVYLIGLARDWIFEEPYHVQPLDLGIPQDESEEKKLPAEAAKSGIRFLETLIVEASDEDSSSSKNS